MRKIKWLLLFLPALAFHSCSTGRFSGLGISVLYDSSAALPYVVEVLSGRPGAMAGLRSGDHILAVNNKSTDHVSAERCLGMLRGRSNTPVTLKVQRGASQPVFSALRQPIHIREKQRELCFAMDSLLKIFVQNSSALASSGAAVQGVQPTRDTLPGFESAYLLNNGHEYWGLYYRAADSLQCRLKFKDLQWRMENCLTYTCCDNVKKDVHTSRDQEILTYSPLGIKEGHEAVYQDIHIQLLFKKGNPCSVWMAIYYTK